MKMNPAWIVLVFINSHKIQFKIFFFREESHPALLASGAQAPGSTTGSFCGERGLPRWGLWQPSPVLSLSKRPWNPSISRAGPEASLSRGHPAHRPSLWAWVPRPPSGQAESRLIRAPFPKLAHPQKLWAMGTGRMVEGSGPWELGGWWRRLGGCRVSR